MKFRGKKFSFEVAQKRLPDGRWVRVDLIEHPGAVVIVPFLNPDTIIFLRQYRPVLGRYLLELPAGTLNKHERPLACARRELIEETDHQGRLFSRLGEIYPVPGYSTEIIHIFKAENLTPQKGCKDEDELIRTRPLKKPDVKKLFHAGRIKDAKTIAALSFCGWL